MWAMVYFRVLPRPLNEIDDDFLDLFFNFANTFTEDSVLQGFIKEQNEKERAISDDVLKELGYAGEWEN